MTVTLTSNELKRLMPVLARHEGVWEGCYRYFDIDGNKIDEHQSRLVCRFPDEGDIPYHQTNYYTWNDGRTEARDFPAGVKDGRLFWDNDLIRGWAADVDLDDFGRTTMLNWVRTGDESVYLYEMIHLSDCGQYRSRVWQWFKDGKLIQRTLIDEERVTTDWRAFEAANPA